MDKFEASERFADYEDDISDRPRSKKKHRPAQHASPRPKPAAERAALTDFSDDVVDFIPTYARQLDPLHRERQWVIDSVAPFYRQTHITDVTRRVKAGKEANVYCCTAHPATGVDWLAAKLYRPRELRTLKNDAVYKAGRMLRGEDGKQLKGRREKLALRQKTRFGKLLDTAWWIGNEYASQLKLHEAGADVPRPLAHAGNAILMDYIGDGEMPAPALIDTRLNGREASRILERILWNIRLMLDLHLVHGDLSAYNMLYQDGEICIIDFPQMFDPRTNPNGLELLRRDAVRVCEHFERYGLSVDGEEFAAGLWKAYMG
jgi:RIO kinase 1